MKLIELIKKQEELNELIGTYPENPDHLAMALLVKCGKVAELLGSEWRWWDVPAECNRAELIGALTDVFKFLLVGMIRHNPDHFDIAHGRWDSNWNDNSSLEKIEAFSALADIAPDLATGDIDDAFYSFLIVVAYTGVTRDEIEASYLALWEKNMQRFSTKQLSI